MNNATDLRGNVLALVGSSVTRKGKRLSAPKSDTPIPARVGTSARIVSETGSGGNSIASPITEDATGGREYWSESPLKSTDGLIYAKYLPLKALNTKDANGVTVVFNFEQPV